MINLWKRFFFPLVMRLIISPFIRLAIVALNYVSKSASEGIFQIWQPRFIDIIINPWDHFFLLKTQEAQLYRADLFIILY